MFNDINPELAYYKSSLESERTRRKQLETLVDVQQQRLTDAESELIQLRANDHKKTLCMKQLEQMIPNVVDEWKGKETDYKSKVTTLTQQIKQLEQSQREKSHQDKQQLDEQLNEKNCTIERLNKDLERLKQEHEQGQTKIKQQEQRIQQLTKDVEQVLNAYFSPLSVHPRSPLQAKQRHSSLESDLRTEIKTAENQTREMKAELEKKQQDIEQMLRDQHKTNNEHQIKARQLDKELDEQRRETVRQVLHLSILFLSRSLERSENGTGIARSEVSRSDWISENPNDARNGIESTSGSSSTRHSFVSRLG